MCIHHLDVFLFVGGENLDVPPRAEKFDTGLSMEYKTDDDEKKYVNLL
jgi:hypothetical protein